MTLAQRRALVAVALLLGSSARVRTAWADDAPTRAQANAGLRVGIAGQGTGALWPETLFATGLSGDVLFGRSSPRSLGLGPAVTVGTVGFRDLSGTLGASLLLPVHDYLPLVVSAGGVLRHHGDFGQQAGVAASLFWGSRSFNYTGTWGLVGGVVLEGRQMFGSPHDHAFLVSAQLDLQVMALPVVMVINALR